jgi:predicted transcriptional regulator
VKVTEKLMYYRHDCLPGEYDSDVYIDMSILQESGISFDTMPVAIKILDKLHNLDFNELDVSLLVTDMDRSQLPRALAELHEKGFIQ